MNNFNNFFSPTSGNAISAGQVQPQPEAGQNQPASFAGTLATSVHPSGQALIPAISGYPPAYQQAPQPRQLSTLDVSPHPATQHLPQLGSPPLDPFLAIATYPPFQLDEYSQIEPFYDYDPMKDINELVREELKEAYAPVEPGEDLSQPIRTDTISTAHNTIDTSADEHFVRSLSDSGTSTSQDMMIASMNEYFERSLSGTSESSQQIRSSTRTPTATETTTQIKKKSRASSVTSTLPSAEPATVPASVLVTVHSDVSSAANQSASEQASDTNKWVIVDKSKDKPFRCGYRECNKSFKHLYNLEAHLVVHTGISRHECPHPGCNDYFGYYSGLKRHILSKHSIVRPYMCDICNKLFSRSNNLMTHKRNVHSVRDERKQPENSTDKWIMHSGNETRPFQCGYEGCSKTYIRKQSLRRHFVSHIGDSQFRCYSGDCTGAIRYCDSQALARHIRRIHSVVRLSTCEICNSQFLRADQLKSHREQVHSIK